jgi:predicted TIM-barrel fold metal-dependent hydrolase
MSSASPTFDWVIDCDTHVTEPADVWTARLPARLRDRAPRIVRDERGYDTWHVGDSTPLIPVGFSALAGWPEPFPSAPRNMDEVPPAAHDAQARLAYMDSIGVWAIAIYPNVGGFGNQGFLSLGDRELMDACVRAYNDWQLDWIAPAPERFIPIAAMPFWDVDACVAEVERCAEAGHKGILFTGEPQVHGQPPLGDRYWDPFYAAAQAAHLPISFHIGPGDLGSDFSPERVRAHGVGPTLVRSTVSLLLGNGQQVGDLLMSGVLPRFPDLHFVSVESGVGWVPFVLETADYAFEYAQVRRERPEYELRPSEYWYRQVHGCWFFEEVAPQRLLDRIGVANVLFETDYPHPVCLYGDVRERIDRALAGVAPDVRRAILFDNAAALYRVPAPAHEPTGAAA